MPKPPALHVINGREVSVIEPPAVIHPWDQQPGEGAKPFAAFVVYRDMTPRTLAETARVRSRSLTLMARWSKQHNWVERAKAWDREQDRRKQVERTRAQADDVRKMYDRHSQQVQAAVQALMLPVMAVLRRMQDPTTQQQIMTMADTDLSFVLQLAQRSAAVLPNLMEVERLIRGEPGVIEEHRHEVSITDNVISDPRAAELATELFGRISEELG
jgi:hypothetical protein